MIAKIYRNLDERVFIYCFRGDTVKKLLFITWSISYGYGTEKSLADVLNRMDARVYDISVLPLFKKSESTIFNENIKILDSLIDYTAQNFDEAVGFLYSVLGISEQASQSCALSPDFPLSYGRIFCNSCL